jgi:membrane-bound metal-dependent hydrolase YbcI (DUF457 family)
MDPLGHASIGLMVKPLAPKAPLWALLAATAVPDLLFFGFQAAGLEYQAVTQFDLGHGLQYLSPPSIPWSHGLFMCIVWSAMVAIIAFLFSRDRRTSIVIGLLVFSHWVLDFIVYPILPVFFDNSRMIGLGLMTSGPGFIASVILEMGLITGGIATY